MGIDVHPQVVINRPRAEVAAYMFDPRNDKVWTTGVVASKPLTEGPLRTGSKVERTSRFLGREFGYVYEVTATDGASFVEMTVTQPFPMQIRYQLQDTPTGTLTSIRAQGDATGFFKLAAPIMAPMVRRNITKDLLLLKETLEARAGK
jgi:hypothetical protein